MLQLTTANDRTAFTAALAAAGARLGDKPVAERRVAIVLANHPNCDGHTGGGVDLDTPAGTVAALEAMAAAGYRVEGAPADGDALIRQLQAGPTDAGRFGRAVEEELLLPDYETFLAALPREVRTAVRERWGPPEGDPMFMAGHTQCGAFAIPAFRCGNVAVGLQPPRGGNTATATSDHSSDLVPPHSYFAFYAWLRDEFRADAVVHSGKHGNLEWLLEKGIAGGS